MRVIAGKYRGRPLRSLRGMDIRPTSDRLRETLFNVLTAGNPQALEGSVWLDLFAGTGAVGIEALSRGARQVYFVETSAAAAKLIEQNLQSLESRRDTEFCGMIFPEFCGACSGSMSPPTWCFSIRLTGCSRPTKKRLRRWPIRRWCGLCHW